MPEVTLHRERCIACGACSEEFPSNARKLIGKLYPVQELVRILLLDREFYRATGGVTFFGGEPTQFQGLERGAGLVSRCARICIFSDLLYS